ncbi:hypothetical protein D917_01147 [Trichinella nativa]|uniref:Uncharacterized protein n=1 Tax=Trichinella nativa TaxID=6335 RepID=A0A1Y3ETZ4_9BILA|nr:hypothetical protein D917_01147 [Trichinella nativa]
MTTIGFSTMVSYPTKVHIINTVFELKIYRAVLFIL